MTNIDFLTLRSAGVDGFNFFSLITTASEPMTVRQLSESTGVSTRGVERIMARANGLIKYVAYKETRGYMEGRPAEKAIVRTPKGTRLLKKCGLEMTIDG